MARVSAYCVVIASTVPVNLLTNAARLAVACSPYAPSVSGEVMRASWSATNLRSDNIHRGMGRAYEIVTKVFIYSFRACAEEMHI